MNAREHFFAITSSFVKGRGLVGEALRLAGLKPPPVLALSALKNTGASGVRKSASRAVLAVRLGDYVVVAIR